MRPVFFHPRASAAIREFPREVRDRLGKALYLLQAGEKLQMPLSRPMPSVAPGVAELRFRDADGQYRTFYCSTSAKGIQVFHAFVKKTATTPDSEIRLVQKRWKEMQADEG